MPVLSIGKYTPSLGLRVPHLWNERGWPLGGRVTPSNTKFYNFKAHKQITSF